MQPTPRDLNLLDFYRASELHGGLLLAHLARRADDAALLRNLSEHASDELRHAALWTEVIIALGGTPRQRKDTYQSRYAARVGAPSGMVGTLALTQVFERRVYVEYQRHLARPDLHPEIGRALRTLLDDEKEHLCWVKKWLDRQPGDVRGVLRRYQEVDEQVIAEVRAEFEGEA